jgi:hypothetical protein
MRRPMVIATESTPPGTPPVDVNGPHSSLAGEYDIGSLQMPAAYRNVNGETTSRLVLVGVLEEAARSLRSMSVWLDANSGALRVAGVGLEELRRVRNLIAKAVPAVHGLGESVIRHHPHSIITR